MDIGTVNLADILSSAMPSSNREDNGESNVSEFYRRDYTLF